MDPPTTVFLTGTPGIGKTTVITRFLERTSLRCTGFYTGEIRGTRGERRGFKVTSIPDGREGVLASVDIVSGPRVGKYRVAVPDFEAIALPAMVPGDGDLLVIDEIGRMELHSGRFREQVQECLARCPVLATVKQGRTDSFTSKLVDRPGSILLEVTRDNRDAMVNHLLDLFG